MDRLIPIDTLEDIPEAYRNTPIGLLLQYHNFNKPFEKYEYAQLLIGMCMDYRERLHVPDNFAYVIRAAGANLHHNEFDVSYAIAVGGIKHIALIGHNHCGMVNLPSRKELYANGLIENAGWQKQKAEEYFSQFAVLHEIGNEVDFILREAKRLQSRFPKVLVAPFLYIIEDGRLYRLEER